MQHIPHRSWQVKSESAFDKGWIQKIKDAVYRHEDVEALYLSFAEDGLVDYWILVPARNLEATRRLIADQQAVISLLAQAPDHRFHLDFHIIYSGGRDAQELVPTGARLIPR